MQTAEMNHTESQTTQIINYLKTGKTLTPLEALNHFGCWALSSRISDIKKQGYKIASVPVKVGKKNVAQYSFILES